MGLIGIVGPGKTRGYPYPVCKKEQSTDHKCIYYTCTPVPLKVLYLINDI